MRFRPFFQQHRWEIALSVAFLSLSSVLYGLQTLMFQSPRDTFFYLLQDLAFVPIQVILVTIVISQLLTGYEKRSVLHKMNIAIGIFFSEMGARFLRLCTGFDAGTGRLSGELWIDSKWDAGRYSAARRLVSHHSFAVDARLGDLKAVDRFLEQQRSLLLSLLENPNLLEHGEFTDMLWAVAHLSEELSARDDLGQLEPADLDHLSGDLERAYSRVIALWLTYMSFLRTDYPFLYSYAIRTNPFNPNAQVPFSY